ncbi:LOW QUALITY PROTEIN: galactose-3-O-sulfotransferase 2 [Lates calcarifer]|uniref:LOW QUALITY PROTEIN: galactose-3-O-sulfotransferase 2 n=1 Tax=Lates calcarifer TaxID=8187 RepID=A0AAJ7VHL0_LATCA|nr:LOW QUALITY PROTEIN: galactose-3-O-sulfotransferase 2 [Lates calcarifer]
MAFHWLAAQLWRHRVAGLMVIMGVTSLLILLGTHLLQRSSHHEWPKGWSKIPAKDKKGLPAYAKQRPNKPYQNYRRSDTQSTSAQTQKDANLHNILRSRAPVVFLKTHKTGGSTVQNLLFRMGEKDRATFAFPYYTYQFSYPDKFRAEFVDELPDSSSQFDILCSHMRLDVEQVKQIMPPNTTYITILREPLQTFESVFSYYTSTIPAFTLAKKVAETAEHKSALSVFLESPESFWDPKEPENGLAKNPMSFDLGLNSQQWNSSWPADLTLLKETFQLVMIAEHFDESLVLLGALLKLELEELAYLRLNTRSPKYVTLLDDITKARLRAWNSLDVLLYDFFLKLFWEKAEQYGLERLNRDVALLKVSTDRIRQKCVARKGVPPEELEDFIRPWQTDSVTILGYQIQGNLTKHEQGFCMRLVLPELQYHAHLYFLQYGRDMRAARTE